MGPSPTAASSLAPPTEASRARGIGGVARAGAVRALGLGHRMSLIVAAAEKRYASRMLCLCGSSTFAAAVLAASIVTCCACAPFFYDRRRRHEHDTVSDAGSTLELQGMSDGWLKLETWEMNVRPKNFGPAAGTAAWKWWSKARGVVEQCTEDVRRNAYSSIVFLQTTKHKTDILCTQPNRGTHNATE
jgi:hypothetical protein